MYRLRHLEHVSVSVLKDLGLGLISKPKLKVSVSSRSRENLGRSRLGLVSNKLSNISVSSRSRKKRSRYFTSLWRSTLYFKNISSAYHQSSRYNSGIHTHV